MTSARKESALDHEALAEAKAYIAKLEDDAGGSIVTHLRECEKRNAVLKSRCRYV
jgi:hypothetical protein